MSAISETCTRAYKIWELIDFFPNVSFITNKKERDYYENGKYEWTGKLQNSVRVKKISEIHGIIV